MSSAKLFFFLTFFMTLLLNNISGFLPGFRVLTFSQKLKEN